MTFDLSSSFLYSLYKFRLNLTDTAKGKACPVKEDGSYLPGGRGGLCV